MLRAFVAILVITTALSAAVGFTLASPVAQPSAVPRAQPSGAAEYARVSPRETARLSITPAGGGRYHVTGFAFWGEHRADTHPVHLGELDFTAMLEGNTLEHSEPAGHRVVLRFADGALHVTEEGAFGVHGLNVTFEGIYRLSDG